MNNPDEAKTWLDKKWFIFFSLAAVVFICYSSALQNDFTNWDDQEYVLGNTAIHFLSFESISYLFSHYLVISYHPLTLLSLAVNYFFSGSSAFGYIFTNIIFHLLNCYLVFVFLCELNLKNHAAYFVALLFAVHPLHVESVAWIAERKDVLYVFFFLLSLIYYCRNFKSGSKKIYFISLLFFLCSCMSKSQAVSLSLILFLIDYLMNGKIELKNVWNKIPFVFMSVMFGVVSVKAQGVNVDAFAGADFTFLQRIAFAAHNYIQYILLLIFPHKLSAYYSYPSSFSANYFLFVVIALALFSGALFHFRKNKTVVFAILFFTLNIFLLLQVFPVGDAMMADRYTYLPSIGLLILIVLAAEHFINKFLEKKYLVQLMAVIYFLFLSQATFARCSVWRNGITLWSDVINNYPETSIAYVNRGANYFDNGNTHAALSDFKKAITLDMNNSFARYNAATIYYNNKDFENCLNILNSIDGKKSADTDAFLLKAYSENKLYDYVSSMRDVEIYLSKKKTAEAFTLAGLNRIMTGDYIPAKKNLDEAIVIDSAFTDAYVKRGALFFQMSDTASACSDWQSASALGNAEVVPFIKLYCE